MKTLTVRVSELTGLSLCYAVCMLEKPHLVWKSTIGIHAHSHQIIVPELKEPDCYSPYTDWAMCGPIIEREGICPTKRYAPRFLEKSAPPVIDWSARYFEAPHSALDHHTQFGPTLLTAAMRCYVASRFGDTVEIPEELLT